MKLSWGDNGVSTYKTEISEFWIRWPEVRSILWSEHYNAMKKIVQMPFSPKLWVGTCYSSQDFLILGHFRWPMCSFDPITILRFIWGHLRSTSFFPLTFDRIEIERWGWSQCIGGGTFWKVVGPEPTQPTLRANFLSIWRSSKSHVLT